MLFGEILSLTNSTGVCYASNAYLAKICNLTNFTVSKLIGNLKDFGYINVENIKENNTKTSKRIITISLKNDDENDNKGISFLNNGGIVEKDKHNNINYNKIINNNVKKPTVEEIEKFIVDNDLKVNASKFYSYYDARKFLFCGKLINWQARLFEWNKRSWKSDLDVGKKEEKDNVELEKWELEILNDMQR